MNLSERLRARELDERLAAIGEVAERRRADGAEIERLLECLESDRKIVQRRAAETFSALAPHDASVQATLTTALHSSSGRRRWGAAYALALFAPLPRDAIPVLIETLGADDGDLRWAAADILVHRTTHVDVLPQLLTLLHRGTTLQRKMAAYCVRDLRARSPESETALLHCLNDPESTVRLAAVAAVVQVACDRSAVAGMVAGLLSDADAGVRRAAAVALGALGERSDAVLSALRAATTRPDPSLQRAARRSLEMLTG